MVSPLWRLSAFPFALAACAGHAASVAPSAQSASVQQCGVPAQPYFEFQVESPARGIPDSTHPHPTVDPFAAKMSDSGATIVQFVVDTSGRPVASTFKILKTPSDAMSRSVRSVFMAWRFRPARVASCPVPQLLQTAVVE
jgi:outer membrane biosynthesis protein TonB